ncbi:hypothetical protein DYI37_08325 [Fulvimarina endophytica]|uniref:Uncharacterized protein n=1 Tax=Fulvimarina endophytica TaxID=2293836 RepID=A0A371X525_9HYPH|nr:hypothetical protein [Fulvimarina endophytica]RFC64323.1 hypothetical protein DYI37_08325 [Fulvimarina endophytica]
MIELSGTARIGTARRLVASALQQPNLYPQIRSDLMALRNRLAGDEVRLPIENEQGELLEAYIAVARRQALAPADEAALLDLARALAS